MGGKWGRRVVTIPAVHAGFVLVTSAFPLLLCLAVLLDLARFVTSRRRFAALRLLGFAWVYLFGQVVGLVALFGAWLASFAAGARRRERLIDLTYATQRLWASGLFAVVRRLFGLRVEIDGDELLEPGPYVLFVRHASIIDTLLPTALVTARHGIRLRFVLKRELLVDPCLDVAGLRLPNHFVARGSDDSAREIAKVGALGEDLGAREGVSIYPEGTRFGPEKQRRALERLAKSDPELHELARSLTHVMPPRLGGSLALLESARGADAVFFAHHGLDGYASIRDIFSQGLGDRVIRVQVRRVPASEIPREHGAQVRWLLGEWQRVDAWVREQARAG